jgi:hypothetical protein
MAGVEPITYCNGVRTKPTENIMSVRMHAQMSLRMHVHTSQIDLKDGRMPALLKTQRSAIKRACWTLGYSGAVFSTLAIMHGPGALTAIVAGAAAMAAAAAAAVGNAIAKLSATLPAIITALSAKKVACIKAKADAKVALEGARRRTTLVNAGLDGKLDAALCLLKLQMLDAQVLARRRLSEDMLRELLPDPRPPHEGDSQLAVIQPCKSGTMARHAKDDTRPTLSLPIDAQLGQSRPRATEHL